MTTTKTTKTATKKTTKTVQAPKKATTSVTSSSKARSNIKVPTLGIILTKYRKTIFVGCGIVILGALLFLGRSLVIAATVNGQPVSRFAIISELEKQGGQQALEKEITRMLVFQEASKKNIVASKEDLDKEIAKITKQVKDQGQDLNELLKAQGISQNDFQNDVKMQIVVTKLLGDKTKVSDKELNDFLSKNADLISKEKDQKKAREDVRQQLSQQKLSTEYQKWIAEIRKNANVLQFVEYK